MLASGFPSGLCAVNVFELYFVAKNPYMRNQCGYSIIHDHEIMQVSALDLSDLAVLLSSSK